MKNLFNIIIGLGVIGYLLYVILKVVQVIFRVDDASWGSITIHLIIVGVFVLFIVLGHFFGDKTNKEIEDESTVSSTQPKIKKKTEYNEFVDKLSFGIYQQKFKTWWSDDYGDTNDHSTVYANLRFYEDGSVLGIRSLCFPKKEVIDSYTMKGNWSLVENKLAFNLEKVSEIDETVHIYISPEDKKSMKYTGAIATNNSLINEGSHKGLIRGKGITIGSFSFSSIPCLKLIITAEDQVCDVIDDEVKEHPFVIDTYLNTGNWYSNGETGHEWFTVEIKTSEVLKDQVENLVKEILKKNKLGVSNMHWGWA